MITIITPTYNRAYILPQLYDSLCRQTLKSFEWIVVDDGSIDSTKQLVSKWIEDKNIDIKYFYQENAGKMQAHNRGVLNASKEYILCVDSDDYLVDNAIELILNKEKCLNNQIGIIAYRGFKNLHNAPRAEFPTQIVDSTLIDLYKVGFNGDTALIYRTEILQKFLFPKFGEEKFITEAYVYDQIDQIGKMALLPKVLIICDYLEDGYTNNTLDLYRKYPIGWRKFYLQRINNASTIKDKIRLMSFSIAYLLLAKRFGLILEGKVLLSIMCFPIGLYLYIKMFYLNRQK